jgi:hypothetical protein
MRDFAQQFRGSLPLFQRFTEMKLASAIREGKGARGEVESEERGDFEHDIDIRS